MLANVDGKLQELHHHLNHDANVVFFTAEDPIGYQTIRRSMSMLFITAVYHVVGQMPGRPSPNVRTVLHFSIDTGFYYTIDEDIEITDEFLADVEREMRRMISLKLPFRKRTITTRDAVDIFHWHGMYDKEKLFRTRLVSRVNVYSLDGYEDYYYGYMTMDTEFLGNFRLLRYHDGVIMVMPVRRKLDEVPEFHPEEKLFEAQIAGEEFAENKQLGCVGELNDHVISGGMRELILISEAHQESRISEIAARIADRGDVKFVLVAGPSSSGKTTFSQRLCVQLHAHGLKPNYIGVDNYFIPRDELPVDENGKKDFECLEAIDLEYFNNDMNALLEGREISVPTYDFVSGKRVFTGESASCAAALHGSCALLFAPFGNGAPCKDQRCDKRAENERTARLDIGEIARVGRKVERSCDRSAAERIIGVFLCKLRCKSLHRFKNAPLDRLCGEHTDDRSKDG